MGRPKGSQNKFTRTKRAETECDAAKMVSKLTLRMLRMLAQFPVPTGWLATLLVHRTQILMKPVQCLSNRVGTRKGSVATFEDYMFLVFLECCQLLK